MEEFISASHDIVFKALFAKNEDILKAFLCNALNLPLTEQASLQVLNDELIPDMANGKMSRLDIHVIMPNKKFNIEMQARKKGFSADRVLNQVDIMKIWIKLFPSMCWDSIFWTATNIIHHTPFWKIKGTKN